MPKGILLTSFAAILFTLGIATTSASANFSSSNGTSKGPLQLKAGTSASFSLEELGETVVTVTCGELLKGEWTIAQVNEKLNLAGQFSKCTEKLGGISNSATVNFGCALVVEQVVTGLTAGVASPCILTQSAKGCVITIAAGGVNTGHPRVSSATVGTKNTEINFNVTGFAATTTKCGLKATFTSFKAAAIAHQQLVV